MPPSSTRRAAPAPAPLSAAAAAAVAAEPSGQSTTTTTTTILRVKRRRDEPPCLPETLLLRTELLQSAAGSAGGGTGRSQKRSRRNLRDDEQLAELMRGSALMGNGSIGSGISGQGIGGHSAGNNALSPPRAPSAAAARFRRVPGGDLSALAAASTSSAGGRRGGEAGRRACKRVRVVDAQIHREPANGENGGGGDHGGAAAAIGGSASTRQQQQQQQQHRGRSAKRARLVLDIVTARDVNGKDCDSDKLVNAGVEFWNSVASATASEEVGPSIMSPHTGKRLILDPATRAVDTSLRAVFRHEKTVLQHLTYLRTDPLLLSVARPPPAAAAGGKWKEWLNHRGNSSQNNTCTGTILHAAAIFNDVDGARLALDLGVDAKVVDGDDHTALAVAETVGSAGVVTLLHSSVAGGHCRGTGIGGKDHDDDDDDADYVFDVYCLAGAKESARERDDWDNWEATATAVDPRDAQEHPNGEAVDENGGNERHRSTKRPPSVGNDDKSAAVSKRKNSNPDMSGSDDNHSGSGSDADECRVEIKGGMTYWNERGELVLEADKHNGGTANGNNDGDSYGEGDDHDSNDEGYEGNDYPEDEDDAMESDDEGGVATSYGFGVGTSAGAELYSSDEEGLALYGRSYRHDPIPAPATTSGWSNVWSDTTQMGDDSDDDRGHALSGFNMDDSDVGDDDEYEGPLGGGGALGGLSRRVTYGEVGLYGEGGACAYDPEYDDEAE